VEVDGSDLADLYRHAADQRRKERREWGLCEHDQHAEHCAQCSPPPPAPRPRRAGSVRFDPYLKVQWYEERSLSWRDVQRSLPDDEAAVRLLAPTIVPPGSRWRLMRVTPEGRSPLPE